jgi:hypothetical protein
VKERFGGAEARATRNTFFSERDVDEKSFFWRQDEHPIIKITYSPLFIPHTQKRSFSGRDRLLGL